MNQEIEFLGITAISEDYREETADDPDGGQLIQAIVVLGSEADELLESAIRNRDEALDVRTFLRD